MKACSKCKIEKPNSEFYKNKSKKDELEDRCKVCSKEAAKGYYQIPEHREAKYNAVKKYRATPEGKKAKRRNRLKREYDITLEKYDYMLGSQGGGCAICGADNPGVGFNHFHIDHDHDTGKIRGLLCSKCNPALGGFKHDIDILAEAIQYLINGYSPTPGSTPGCSTVTITRG